MTALDTANLLRHDVRMAQLNRERLASFVIARRMEIGIRDRRALQRISGLSDRTIGTLERGGTVNAATLGAIENALNWEPGSAKRILEGGEPVVKGQQAAPEPVPKRVFSDPRDQRLWDSIADVVVTGDPAEDEKIKKGWVVQVRAAREVQEREEGERRRAG